MSYQSRIEEMKEKKRKQELFRKQVRKLIPYVAALLGFLIIIVSAIVLIRRPKDKEIVEVPSKETSVTQEETLSEQESSEEKEIPMYKAERTNSTRTFGEDILSEHAILIDLSTDTIIASKDENSRIVPASMTKILTALVASEHVDNLDEKVTVTQEMVDYCFKNDCSTAGFTAGEVVTVRDLFYGTILPSGGEAAVGLAIYTAGSQEEFVKLMNAKLKEIGIEDTAKFTNCIGIYDENHYCTTYDMAMIMEAAMDNAICREVMSAHTYTTSFTKEHPEGLLISNWFLRKIEDKDAGLRVACAKTGYVVQSENCAASFGEKEDGSEYVCVTARAYSGWRCIYDHVAAYKNYIQ